MWTKPLRWLTLSASAGRSLVPQRPRSVLHHNLTNYHLQLERRGGTNQRKLPFGRNANLQTVIYLRVLAPRWVGASRSSNTFAHASFKHNIWPTALLKIQPVQYGKVSGLILHFLHNYRHIAFFCSGGAAQWQTAGDCDYTYQENVIFSNPYVVFFSYIRSNIRTIHVNSFNDLNARQNTDESCTIVPTAIWRSCYTVSLCLREEVMSNLQLFSNKKLT